jgi:hypothetical protein
MGVRGHADHIFKQMPEKYGDVFGSVEWYRNYQAVTAACMMMRREVFDVVNGFDEEYKIAFGDVDICLRVYDAGFRNMYTPFARLYHHEGKSRVGGVPAQDILRACDAMEARIAAGDPYFNPNLSYSQQVPTLSQPNEIDRATRIQNTREEVQAVDPNHVYRLQ